MRPLSGQNLLSDPGIIFHILFVVPANTFMGVQEKINSYSLTLRQGLNMCKRSLIIDHLLGFLSK